MHAPYSTTFILYTFWHTTATGGPGPPTALLRSCCTHTTHGRAGAWECCQHQGSTMTVFMFFSSSARRRMVCTSTGGYRCSSFMLAAKSPCRGQRVGTEVGEGCEELGRASHLRIPNVPSQQARRPQLRAHCTPPTVHARVHSRNTVHNRTCTCIESVQRTHANMRTCTYACSRLPASAPPAR